MATIATMAARRTLSKKNLKDTSIPSIFLSYAKIPLVN